MPLRSSVAVNMEIGFLFSVIIELRGWGIVFSAYYGAVN